MVGAVDHLKPWITLKEQFVMAERDNSRCDGEASEDNEEVDIRGVLPPSPKRVKVQWQESLFTLPATQQKQLAELTQQSKMATSHSPTPSTSSSETEEPSDLVAVEDSQLAGGGKLKAKFKGPYVVRNVLPNERYALQKQPGRRTTVAAHEQLRPSPWQIGGSGPFSLSNSLQILAEIVPDFPLVDGQPSLFLSPFCLLTVLLSSSFCLLTVLLPSSVILLPSSFILLSSLFILLLSLFFSLLQKF
ncbi:hypothetical protein NQ318_018284 [Aromia moschata]|uniref:Uncharacterized protein n=1 Tax=Aromia moschata TaxID=1265417 RepID=A0AAV8ZDL2_9CUCU|nr:hypothetical protein NQ318_018284 [Aromia moschata]